MRFKHLSLAALGVVLTASGFYASSAIAQDEQFIPLLVYRSGPYAPNGIPLADGQSDYYKLVNARDGGVNGITITTEECDTAYNNDRGVECYERLKANGPTGASVFMPFSTGITYALIERATQDKIPIHSMGYGRTDASDGRVFPYVFTLPATYWSQASVFIKYIGEKEGGMDKLKGKKIALVYHDSAYGKEPIKTLQTLADTYGYNLSLFPVPHPGLEQKATWLKIGRQLRPDWVLMWGWGVMNSTAIKEAAAVGYPMDKFIGVWWSGSEQDVIPAGQSAKGYLAGTFHAPGGSFPVHDEIRKYVHEAGDATGDGSNIGTVLYNRGLTNAMIVVEALRTAQAEYGNRPLTGEEVRWGFEHLNITAERLTELGMNDFVPPMSVSCADHEGDHPMRIQQWDGEKWSFVSDWIDPMKDVLRPMIEESAAGYAAEKGITPRDC
ncbi:MAG: ABC transporter substrate-binding protein [Candidatus Competibacteraceae bacterium]|nr:ABC transporter substrate-binding protein [Candidatus Competibacteraceae bacterium]MCB1810819.1 ABC transporter substrate-binding protein [Candidatus Competibacteraceae bacterium]